MLPLPGIPGPRREMQLSKIRQTLTSWAGPAQGNDTRKLLKGLRGSLCVPQVAGAMPTLSSLSDVKHLVFPASPYVLPLSAPVPGQ